MDATLSTDSLRAVCDMQREQIRMLRRQVQELTAHNRRLQEQVTTLIGQVQEAHARQAARVERRRMIEYAELHGEDRL